MNVSLREIQKKDKDLLLTWRNDPSIYLLGGQQRKVTLEEHNMWFPKLLEDEKSFNFIITHGQDVGQLRLSFIEKDVYKITLFFIEKYRKMGLGTQTLKAIQDTVLERGQKIIAEILKENSASLYFFTKNDFIVKLKSERLMTLEKTI
tara:strand:- start:1219 stop:1662 length:444 start_codon:yes stop_codon:yes gene_type:complete